MNELPPLLQAWVEYLAYRGKPVHWMDAYEAIGKKSNPLRHLRARHLITDVPGHPCYICLTGEGWACSSIMG